MPWPRRVPAASLGCMSAITAQETEGLFPALVRQYVNTATWDSRYRKYTHKGRRDNEAWEAGACPTRKGYGSGDVRPGTEAVRGHHLTPRQTLRERAFRSLALASDSARLRDRGREWKQESGHVENLSYRSRWYRGVPSGDASSRKSRLMAPVYPGRKGLTGPATPAAPRSSQPSPLPEVPGPGWT